MIMSAISSTTAHSPTIAQSLLPALAGAPGRWWATYTAWRIERWAIKQLGAMSDRQLQDIGLVRSQIPFAVKGHGRLTKGEIERGRITAG
jgi:uncharacterized protein YjiS (DUF1127 family)